MTRASLIAQGLFFNNGLRQVSVSSRNSLCYGETDRIALVGDRNSWASCASLNGDVAAEMWARAFFVQPSQIQPRTDLAQLVACVAEDGGVGRIVEHEARLLVVPAWAECGFAREGGKAGPLIDEFAVVVEMLAFPNGA